MPVNDAPRIKWLVEPKFDEDGVQATSGLGPDGREHPDPVPLRPPLDLRVSQGDELHTAIRNIMLKEREAFAAAVQAEEFETEAEANDFITEDDVFPPGNEPWEDIFEFPVQEPEVVANGPTLASGAVKGEPAPQSAAPPASASQRSSEGSLPSSTSSGSSAGTPTAVPGSGISDQRERPRGSTDRV